MFRRFVVSLVALSSALLIAAAGQAGNNVVAATHCVDIGQSMDAAVVAAQINKLITEVTADTEGFEAKLTADSGIFFTFMNSLVFFSSFEKAGMLCCVAIGVGPEGEESEIVATLIAKMTLSVETLSGGDR